VLKRKRDISEFVVKKSIIFGEVEFIKRNNSNNRSSEVSEFGNISKGGEVFSFEISFESQSALGGISVVEGSKSEPEWVQMNVLALELEVKIGFSLGKSVRSKVEMNFRFSFSVNSLLEVDASKGESELEFIRVGEFVIFFK